MTPHQEPDKAQPAPPRFNLIDEPWIPVLRLNGTRCELGIRDTLLQADQIAEIQDSSPLVVAALHRLLLAVLYRALEGPTDGVQARHLFKSGLPHARILEYLTKWGSRFDLFDQSHPFGQNPNVPKDKIEPWTKLTAEYNGPSSKVLFDHTNARQPDARHPKECALWLIATMNFSVSGGRGYYPSPSANAMMCLALGATLTETLIFNLIPYANRFVREADTAIWELDPTGLPLASPNRLVKGYADLYTWPARFVHLMAGQDGMIRQIRFMSAYSAQKPTEGAPTFRDPMVPYLNSPKHGLIAQGLDPNRATWRHFDSLLPDANDLAPQNICHVAGLLRGTGRSVRSILTLGQKYDPPNADINFWRMENFSYPNLHSDPRLVKVFVARLLEKAQKCSWSLEGAMKAAAKMVLARTGRDLKDDKYVAGKWVPGDASNFIGKRAKDGDPTSLGAYWSILERAFHEILKAVEKSGAFEMADEERIERLWLARIKDAAQVAWQTFVEASRSSGAYDIRAIACAEPSVTNLLARLQHEIHELDPLKEST
jgi:CRISPR system Cascade subunit CasA